MNFFDVILPRAHFYYCKKAKDIYNHKRFWGVV